VSNLHHTVNETVLKDVFKAIGDVKSVEIEYDRTDRSTGRGYVIFEREEDARRAVSEYQGQRTSLHTRTFFFCTFCSQVSRWRTNPSPFVSSEATSVCVFAILILIPSFHQLNARGRLLKGA